MFLYIVDLLGTAIFAVSGVSMAFRLKMDAVGVLVLASVVAIGGGTIRDIVLDVPVFWLTDNNYIWVVIATCVLMIAFTKKPTRLPWYILPVSDAVGLAFFAIMGAEKALHYGFSPTVAVLMGTLTGCGGGVLRDVLARQIPFIFQKEIYASACIMGATVYCLLDYSHLPRFVNVLVGIAVVLVIRLTAIKWQLSLPVFSKD
ncbi:trimeric intracellular cation channel family protein [Phocoenobacter skyensis]|uniref:Trimeric intracellular cation channel family protein n=1 Tax=Phocoenobacter skyensis TaxID=97481 RepID=A0A1H7VGC6_9PAST|nr:trimeric intracellular cation channel family protein [Pasteurella skyensis]MDP8079343.1 trimeric intracellular cation channel family protein [Pasteurella skyensis]MDP8085215.1 trimeric intracellular cation channel family protein [Pasteurella skyensis]MDP8162670.1 trimeric intracellular cation channel family protein [Pasteurella skyensis]MDP8171406.1 trimeric intracellular cation channel family protein [Pasteurella skyensis]MDP8173438.1 trimeric intracellular cation channel family protein [P